MILQAEVRALLILIEREIGAEESEISTQANSVVSDLNSPRKCEKEPKENDCIFPIAGKRSQVKESAQENQLEPSLKKKCADSH